MRWRIPVLVIIILHLRIASARRVCREFSKEDGVNSCNLGIGACTLAMSEPDRRPVRRKSHPPGVDMFTPERRSEIMSRIQGRNTKPEVIVRSLLHRLGYRFRLHRKDLPGRPDIVLPKYRTVVLVHGCFWHLHSECPGGRLPTKNREFWKAKLERNRDRDYMQEQRLRELNWEVVVLWECEIEKDLKGVTERLERLLRGVIRAET